MFALNWCCSFNCVYLLKYIIHTFVFYINEPISLRRIWVKQNHFQIVGIKNHWWLPLEILKYPSFYKIILDFTVTSGGSCTPTFQRITPFPSGFWCQAELLKFLASVLVWIVSLPKPRVQIHKFGSEGYVGQAQTYLKLGGIGHS